MGKEDKRGKLEKGKSLKNLGIGFFSSSRSRSSSSAGPSSRSRDDSSSSSSSSSSVQFSSASGSSEKTSIPKMVDKEKAPARKIDTIQNLEQQVMEIPLIKVIKQQGKLPLPIEIIRLNERIELFKQLINAKDENKNIILEQGVVQQIYFLTTQFILRPYVPGDKYSKAVIKWIYEGKLAYWLQRYSEDMLNFEFEHSSNVLPALGKFAEYSFYRMAGKHKRENLLVDLIEKEEFTTELKNILPEEIEIVLLEVEKYKREFNDSPPALVVKRMENYYYSLTKLNYTLLSYLTQLPYKINKKKDFRLRKFLSKNEKLLSTLHPLLLSVNQEIMVLINSYPHVFKDRYQKCEGIIHNIFVDLLKCAEREVLLDADKKRFLDILCDNHMSEEEIKAVIRANLPRLNNPKIGIERIGENNSVIWRIYWKNDNDDQPNFNKPIILFRTERSPSSNALEINALYHTPVMPFLVEPFCYFPQIISGGFSLGTLNIDPYLPLGDLYNLSKTLNNITLLERQYWAVELCAQVCTFLIRLLEQKTIYTDLKPENVLVSYKVENATYEVKFADLKSCRRVIGMVMDLINNEYWVNQQDIKGFITRPYVAQEMLAIEKGVNISKSYLWLVGVLLYTFLTQKMNSEWLSVYKEEQKCSDLDLSAPIFNNNHGNGKGKQLASLCEKLLMEVPEARVGDIHQLESNLIKLARQLRRQLDDNPELSGSALGSTLSPPGPSSMPSGMFFAASPSHSEQIIKREQFASMLEKTEALQDNLVALMAKINGKQNAKNTEFNEAIFSLQDVVESFLRGFPKVFNEKDPRTQKKKIRNQFLFLGSKLTAFKKNIDDGIFKSCSSDVRKKLPSLSTLCEAIGTESIYVKYYNTSISNSSNSGSSCSSAMRTLRKNNG